MGKVLSFGELEIEMPHQSERWLKVRGQSVYSARALPAFGDRGEDKLQKRGPL